MMKTLLWAIVLFSLNTLAGVHLRNGNFFVSYTDLSATEKGTTLELTRTYNSKSTYKGWFGYGWGTPFEVRLEVSSDGSIIIYENGSGAVNRFIPGAISVESINKVVDEVIAVVKKSKSITAETEKSLRASLLKDDQYRHRITKKYGVVAQHSLGEKLLSEDFGGQELVVSAEGYQRKGPNGLEQYFNKNGTIIKTRNQSGYGLDFSYNKAGEVNKIVDTYGNQFQFEWYSGGTVKSVTSQDRKKAEYTYKDEDLVSVTDAEKITFNYAFDGNHNLIKLTDTSLKEARSKDIIVEYDAKSFNTTKVINRDGSENIYFYENNPQRPNEETTTIVVRKDATGGIVAEKYLYDYRKRADGSEWLARTQTITEGTYDLKTKKFSGGYKEELIYNEKFPYPMKKIEGELEANYTYTKNGLLETKTVKQNGKVTEKTKYGYDTKFNKMNYVKTDEAEYKYEYNTKGDLVKAIEKNGNAILFVYDVEGRINKMYEKNSGKKKARTLTFVYNVKGKPTEVELEGVGKLSLTYDSQTLSKVEDIKSNKGLEVFNQVRDVFNNFMEVVKPTGINMNL